MACIFVSYARQDAERPKCLGQSLQRAGHEVWWDRHIHGGSRFAAEIDRELAKAEVVLVLWSQFSIHSAWVQDEASEGRDTARLVPITLDASKPPLGFRQYQSIDLSNWNGRGSPADMPLVLAAIQATTAGSEKQGVAAAEQPKSAAPFWRSVRIAPLVLVVLAAAGLVLGVWKFLAAENTPVTPTIAVLPFSDLSPGGRKAYFSEGVAEAILTRLAQEPGLSVIGRTSSWQFKDRTADLPAIRKALGATHILEGSALAYGEQLRLSVRLIDATTGKQLWTQVFDRKIENVFAVQDEVTTSVAKRLSTELQRLGKLRQTPSTSINVYDLYLAARAKMRSRTEADLEGALTLAQQAIQADPSYAPAHALAAELYWLLSDLTLSYGRIPAEEALKIGEQNARQAIRLAPNAPEGYAALGAVFLGRSVPLFQQIEQNLKRAINLDPARAELRTWLGQAYNLVGRNAEALEQYRLAFQIEPLWAVPLNRLIRTLAASGQHAEANALLQNYIRRGGNAAQGFALQVCRCSISG